MQKASIPEDYYPIYVIFPLFQQLMLSTKNQIPDTLHAFEELRTILQKLLRNGQDIGQHHYRERFMSTKHFILTTLVSTLAACGGSSPETEQTLDKYDINSYTPKVIGQTDLTGAWLYVMNLELNYSEDEFPQNESAFFRVEMRTIINIVESEEGIEAYTPLNWCTYAPEQNDLTSAPFNRCFSTPTGYAHKDGNTLTLDLGNGEFIGEIDQANNQVNGEVSPYSEDLLTNIQTTIHSSQGGMVKLSNTPSHPHLSDHPSVWGTIEYTDTPLHLNSFYEATTSRQITGEGGNTIGSDHIYSLKLYSTHERNLDSPLQNSIARREYQFEITENIQAGNTEEYPPGWYITIGSVRTTIPPPQIPSLEPPFSGIPITSSYTSWGADIQAQSPLVSITNVSEIIGNVSGTTIDGNPITDEEIDFTLDIFVSLD